MKTTLYAIFDTASGTYQKPIFARADGEIMREFQNICTDADHPCGAHPEDYSLFRLGNFNDQNGAVSNEQNVCLATGLEVVANSRMVHRDQMDMLDTTVATGFNAPDAPAN